MGNEQRGAGREPVGKEQLNAHDTAKNLILRRRKLRRIEKKSLH